jgi:hypothetical protein
VVDPYLYPEMLDDPLPPRRTFKLLVDARGWFVQRVDGPQILRPENTSIEEGKLLARRACYALEATDEDGAPLGDWRLPFWGGWVAGAMTAAVVAVVWKAASTFLGGAA